jgi:hypothetical protein
MFRSVSEPCEKNKIPFLLFATIITIIFTEGALTKWIGISSFSIMAVRDLLCVWLIAIFFLKSKDKFDDVITRIVLYWTIFIIFLSIISTLIYQLPIILVAISLRFWLLYLWMAVSASYLLTNSQIKKTFTLIIYIAIINVIIATFQVNLPVDHFINYTLNSIDSYVFVLANGIVRATGTFSFTLGYTCFVSLAIIFLLNFDYIERDKKNMDRFASYYFTLIAFLLVIYSGSRACILWGLFIITVHFLIKIKNNVNVRNGKEIFLFFIVFFIVVIVIFFYKSEFVIDYLSAYVDRFESAAESEGFFERFITMIFGESYVYNDFLFYGHGFGLGNNAASLFLSGQREFTLAETESGRNIMEAGVVGMLWILFKAIFSIYFCIWSFLVYRRSNNVIPLLLSLTFMYSFLTWQVHGQISANGIAYVILTFLLYFYRNNMFQIKIVTG